MKTEFQYLIFKQISFDGKTTKWSCKNKHHDEELGIVKWNATWRQYCYFPTVQAVYSAGCLNDIVEFIKELKDIKLVDMLMADGL